MPTRLAAYTRMMEAAIAQDPERYGRHKEALAILRALTPEEAAVLDAENSLPPEARLAAIAASLGCPFATVRGVYQGYLYKFTEGLRVME